MAVCANASCVYLLAVRPMRWMRTSNDGSIELLMRTASVFLYLQVSAVLSAGKPAATQHHSLLSFSVRLIGLSSYRQAGMLHFCHVQLQMNAAQQ